MRTLTTSLHQLSIYLTKFRNRLSTVNSLHLKRLTGLLEAIAKYATEWGEKHARAKEGPSPKVDDAVMTSAELLDRLGQKVQGVNLLEVEAYLRKSKVLHPITRCRAVLTALQIARKIAGYCAKELEKAAGQGEACG